MFVQELSPGSFVEVKSTTPMIEVNTPDGVVYWPGQIVETWSLDQLEEVGIFPAEAVSVPPGHALTNVSYSRDEDGTIRQHGDLIIP